MRPASSACSDGPRWRAALVRWLGRASWVFLLCAASAAAQTSAPIEITQAQRTDPRGNFETVALPDTWQADPPLVAPDTVVRLHYRLQAELGVATRPQALYFSGLLAHARITLNGRLLFDHLGDAEAPRPNGAQALLLLDVPADALQPGLNTIDVVLAGRRRVSLSQVRLGERQALRRLHDSKVFLMVTGPVVVASVIGCLGLAVLLLYLRRRSEGLYAYFGVGAVLWSLHTLWGELTRSLITGVHLFVWWTTLYAALVAMLVIFVLRFADHSRPAIERALLGLCAVAPPLLYGAAALGHGTLAGQALRLVLVLIAFGALVVIAHHAWRRRSIDSALLTLAGLTSTGFGLRDWLVFSFGNDNLPVELTPYAGLPFIVLVSWLLLERFVRASEALASMNDVLEQRVAAREAELADNYTHVAKLEREQAAGDERQRIMRDLHDGLGSQLFVSLSRVERGALDSPGVALELRRCIADMRLAIEALAPEEQNIRTTLGNFMFRWEALLREAGVRPQWAIEVPDEAPAVPPHVVLQLLRVLQEALTNVLKHAQAREVCVAVRQSANSLTLSVEDDGRGLPPDPMSTAGGRGLANMRSRAQRLGAQIELQSTPGRTRLALKLELPANPG